MDLIPVKRLLIECPPHIKAAYLNANLAAPDWFEQVSGQDYVCLLIQPNSYQRTMDRPGDRKPVDTTMRPTQTIALERITVEATVQRPELDLIQMLEAILQSRISANLQTFTPLKMLDLVRPGRLVLPGLPIPPEPAYLLPITGERYTERIGRYYIEEQGGNVANGNVLLGNGFKIVFTEEDRRLIQG